MLNLDPLAVVAWILLISGCLGLARRDMGEAPMSSSLWRKLWAFKYAILVAAGGAIWFGEQLFEKVGIMPGWPDAIHCTSYIPSGANEKQEGATPSDVVFYLNATLEVGNRLGKVVRYDFIAGIGARSVTDDADITLGSPQPHYVLQVVNPIWFIADGVNSGYRVFQRNSLLRIFGHEGNEYDLVIVDHDKIKQTFADDGNDGYEKNYARSTGAAVVCGTQQNLGYTLSEIKAAG